MRIIISPAKQMRIDTDLFTCTELPVFMEKTEILMRWIQSLSYEEQKKLWVCSDKIACQNSERFAHMDLRKNLTPALLAYDGIQYTYMAPAVFEDGQYDYVQEHLRILSGFYGVVKPMDGRTCMISGETSSTGRSLTAAGSSLILPPRNTPSASRNTYSRMTDISPVFLASRRAAK